MIYCDTSFLLALYVGSDFFHPHATKVAAKFSEGIPYSLLVELELTNGIRRALVGKLISLSEHDEIFRLIDDDLAEGILVRVNLQQGSHYQKARELSKRHTPDLACRSLDILQVAAAILLGATTFCSFDEKQRKLAAVAGLKVLPPVMPVRLG